MKKDDGMDAGYAKACITPPLGTRMCGYAERDRGPGCEAVHDDLYVRAGYLRHGNEQVLFIAI